MTGRVYMGGSAEPSVAEINQEMSELLDKQVNAQKERVHVSSRKPMKKVYDENEAKKKKTTCAKNIIHGRKSFIMPIQETGENNLHELRVNNYGYNEGTICLANG